MVFSTLRFMQLDWVTDHFIETQFTFKYFGFSWVELLPPGGMYVLHLLMLLGAVGITLGLFYRWSAVLFFLCFTYTELIDLTYYLNHYYFVSLTSFLLIWVPANGRFSVDAWWNPQHRREQVPAWAVGIFKLQIAIVYVYAGWAKINSDWLLEALPLRIWLPGHDHMPLLGPLFAWAWTPYLFSWIGMLYDTTIVFFLSWRKTRALAYLSVVIFHTLTGLLFQIGVFPLVMMGGTWIFFSTSFHERLLGRLEGWFATVRLAATAGTAEGPGGVVVAYSDSGRLRTEHPAPQPGAPGPGLKVGPLRKRRNLWVKRMLVLYFAFQLLFPWRYLLYPGNIFWTEEGYRFSWRVMLMEKAGTATFYVQDRETGREGIVVNSDFLAPHQEKQMAMQPDMILQFAHFLADHYTKNGQPPKVRAEVFVTLNGRPSRLLFDPQLDLTLLEDGWAHKEWIYPYEEAPRE